MPKRRLLQASQVPWTQAGGGTSGVGVVYVTPTGAAQSELYASGVRFVPVGGITERDVQQAIAGVDGRKLSKTGGSMTGLLLLFRAPAENDNDMVAATKGYVDTLTDDLVARSISVRDLRNLVVFLVDRDGQAAHFGDVTRPHIRYQDQAGVQVDQATIWPSIAPGGANRFLFSADGITYQPARFMVDESGDILADDDGEPIMQKD